tara:strand:+ start:442 stop:699 length:258 start_codon:yes stop_codon:yes gene_type:complete
MFTKVKNFIFLLFFLSFSSLTIKYYISENNIININKSRSSYVLSNSENLPILKNDTNNIIVYKDDIEEFKKSRKKRFWEKLISND